MTRTQYKAECANQARKARRFLVYSAGCVGCHNSRFRTVAYYAGAEKVRIPLSQRAEGCGSRLKRSHWGYLLSGLDFTDPWVDSVITTPRKERVYWRARAAYAEGFKAPDSFFNADVEFAESAFKRARKLARKLEPRDDDYELAKRYLEQLAIYRVCESRWVKDGGLELMTEAASAMYVAVREAWEKQKPPETIEDELTY